MLMAELGKLKDFHKDQLLHWFFYHLSSEDRGKLMKDLPQAYNAACNAEIVVVVHCSDPTRKAG
jgi:hypothetical protein